MYATLTLGPIWKQGVSKRGILKSLVSHVLNFLGWIQLICDKITYIYCVINEFDPTFEVQNITWDVACFETPRFQTGTRVKNCLWAKFQ